ncbi:MAG: hypothetical protein HON90_14175 [Halobacteriovoraceae bacterium]|jgi:hypothetical protein|nr:hypothetical protein [Halobacteriovoraceae bacterium]
MKRYLSLIALLSLFLIQIHGFTHFEADTNERSHHCIICEVASDQPYFTQSTLAVDFTPKLISQNISQPNKNYFAAKSFISKNIIPRAPPTIA